MKPLPIFLAAALALGLTACGGTGEDSERQTPSSPPAVTDSAPPQAEETPPVQSALPTELVWTDQTYAQEFTAADGTVVMSVDYVFPAIEEAAASPVWQKITDYYAAEGAAYMDTARELAGYAEGDYQVAQAMGEDFLPYGEAHSYRISYQSDSLVSIVRSYYANSVTGAAHPANYQFSELFSLKTGDRLALSSLFTDSSAGQERVLDLLAERAAGAGYTREDLKGQFNESYFYLNDTGFVFYYQPDTLAPHAAGILEFAIPYAELEDLLCVEAGEAA